MMIDWCKMTSLLSQQQQRRRGIWQLQAEAGLKLCPTYSLDLERHVLWGQGPFLGLCLGYFANKLICGKWEEKKAEWMDGRI